jgi:hypothetical protein
MGDDVYDTGTKRPVLSDEEILLHPHDAAIRNHLKSLAFMPGERDAIGVLVVGGVVHYFADEFFRCITENPARSWINEQDTPIRANCVQSFAHALEYCVQQLGIFKIQI